MFAMTAALGLPCVMFTVTPEDGINFRIRVMFKGEKGSETPPNFVLDEETIRKFISESEHIRFDHPGLCAIDFENVIGITVEHILGWDLNKNINKPGYGFFGDLDGWTYAVEEQGRKTLHAHFLLWIKGWGKLRSGLGTAKGHEEYVKQVSKYADRVMCTRLHGSSSRLVPKVCHNDCSNTVEGTEGYQKCTTQDLRKLRTKQGETSLGAKKILFCSVCKASLSSEDVTLQRLKQYYGDALAGEDENFWLSSRYSTKCCVLMEMEVLHSMLPPKYESQINMERFTPSARLKFIVAALRNLHKSDHSPSCFKKGSECRMKLPAYPSTETLVMFDDKVTSWFDWRGNDISRSLSICVPKRAHADAYVNVHSEFASILFGCNTNVITGVDGGSVMYCTSYVSKNTEKEDNKHFADAAKHMVKNMQQQMAERKELLDLELEEEASSVGLKVSINGETTAKAFTFKREVRNELEEFKHAYLVIVDEISFASVEDVDVLNQKMKQILDNTMAPFGGVPVVFSGDFTQLSPVGGIPLYRRDEGAEWRQSINVFMELKTNHRFGKDLVWGELLGRFRDHGPTTDEVATINARVVGARNSPLEKNVPSDAVYATKTNVDRMAINDAIFVKHLEKAHFTDPNRQPPMHTLCIKAGNPRFHLTGTRKEYRVMENKAQDVMYAAVGEAHVSDKCKKYHDPLLKLYLGRPLCINQNEDVSSCIANGAMCEFRGVKLKPGASMDQFETIVIDGYYVNCVSVTQVESLLLKMLDGNAGEEGEHIIELNPKTIYASARFPVPCLGPITKKSMRTSRRISFDQFPINCANARTVHKLQGRSIKNLVVIAWDYTGNWIYVCLSRCTTLHGLFLREPLNPNKTKGMSEEVKAFMKSMREIQQYDRVHLHREDL
ncbi:PIF1-like helicase [Nitzschia inconspicua]|uniref:ATP-dependent DNA helicase n=1 Tax=Nitzschia inconspicua TaxID=303405 RepID=A0A9K3LMB1_9STRA|nr:PIF1-like helicase [Nitzschia inconspicua]